MNETNAGGSMKYGIEELFIISRMLITNIIERI
jgi:hypothetical protein